MRIVNSRLRCLDLRNNLRGRKWNGHFHLLGSGLNRLITWLRPAYGRMGGPYQFLCQDSQYCVRLRRLLDYLALLRRAHNDCRLLLRRNRYYRRSHNWCLLFCLFMHHFYVRVRLRGRPCVLTLRGLNRLRLRRQSCLLSMGVRRGLCLHRHGQSRTRSNRVGTCLLRI